MEDFYKILGIAADASQDEIKKAYRLLALQYHPDKNNGDIMSAERFRAVAEAYATLGDISKRDAYDCARGNRQRGRAATQGVSVALFLVQFKKIKNKVFNAGGRINEQALFKSIDSLLTDENIAIMVKANDVCTTNLILDEILISCVFLGDAFKAHIHTRLLQVANGDYRFIKKIGVLV